MSSAVYVSLVKTTEEYLGPASTRFIDRQVSSHLQKEPVTLEPSDIPKLVDWLKVSFGAMTGNKVLVDEYVAKILKLSQVQSAQAV